MTRVPDEERCNHILRVSLGDAAEEVLAKKDEILEYVAKALGLLEMGRGELMRCLESRMRERCIG